MSHEIPPALSREEWEWCLMEAEEIVRDTEATVQDYLAREYPSPARTIALANAALPDDDPRKLRREWIADLRIAQNEAQDAAWRSCQNGEPGKPCDECQRAVDGFKARLQALAAALESYLPPEDA